MKFLHTKFKGWLIELFLFVFIFLVAQAYAGNYSILMSGAGSTNVGWALNSGTNTSSVNTNNYFPYTVPGASNVLFTLSTSFGAVPPVPSGYLTNTPPGTNAWPPTLPAVVFNPQGNYPNTLYGPYNNALLVETFNLMATNATSTTITEQFAGTVDGVLWQTNALTLTYVVPANSLTPTNGIESCQWTTTAWPIYALQQINNPGVAAMTNIVMEVNGKPGI